MTLDRALDAAARRVRSAALLLWRVADRIHPPADGTEDAGDYWTEESDDNASHDTAHPAWIEGCSACQERAERRERHPSAWVAPVVPITPGRVLLGGREYRPRGHGASEGDETL